MIKRLLRKLNIIASDAVSKELDESDVYIEEHNR